MMHSLLTVVLLASGNLAQTSDTNPQESKVLESKAQSVAPDKIQEILAEAKKYAETEESFVGIGGECHVDSRVNVYVNVYINGQFRGRMVPFGDIYPMIGDFSNEITVLRAVSTCGRYSWSRTVSGPCNNFQWILRP